jgi:hypothetical protein
MFAGAPIVLAFLGGFAVLLVVLEMRKRARERDWALAADLESSSAEPASQGDAPSEPGPRRLLEGLRRVDPEFSIVVFEDFLYALYAETQRARGEQALDRLAAFVDAPVRATLASPGLTEVRDVVVGAMQIEKVAGVDGGHARVEVGFEANFTEVGADGEQAYYAADRWTLSRPSSARSRPPERAATFDCPGCGAPQDAVITGTCAHCGKVVSSGDFDWMLLRAESVEREPKPPMLTSTVAEKGNDLPTVVDPEAEAAIAKLHERDPAFLWGAFEERVRLVYAEFSAAWVARDLARMRPFFTDRLLDAQRYWVEAYRKQGLTNHNDDAQVERVELACVTSDRHFTAITVRLHASSIDYTLEDATGRHVAGNRRKPRAYTEYWTFLRGATAAGAARTDKVCPSCGAPLEINMAGTCKYCEKKVTSGDFDWVLGRIEQDEVYAG